MEFKSIEYINLFKQRLNGISDDEYIDKLPNDFIEIWLKFVNELYKGYDFSGPEFDNDLDMIREPIEHLLNDTQLKKFDDHNTFCNEINRIDIKFKEITTEIPNLHFKDAYWWKNVVLKYAKKEYAEFINSHFKENGINVKIIE